MTIDALIPFYPWVKSLHVISVISWMAGVLYLPRLFIYHCETPAGSEGSERFKVMERRLLKIIMNPAMFATWIFGTLLVLTPGVIDWSAGWWHAKMCGILVITGMHHVYAIWFKRFRDDRQRRPTRHYRIANEIPTIAMIVIVFMVIARPV